MTQPAVSQYIRSYEDRFFRCNYFERSFNESLRGPKREKLSIIAKEIAGLYTKMQNLVDDFANKLSGPLTIGASYTFSDTSSPYSVLN